jgi:rSAM/selenodomain-associated transferase 2
MQISIIIPTLNEVGSIVATLKRVLSLPGFYEVIVVDGGSQDKTAELAQAYSRVIRATGGRAGQMNAGAAAAGGEVLLFLHADTVLPEKALKAVEQALSDNSVIGGRFRVRLDCPAWRYRAVGSCINWRDRILKGFTGDQAIFIRRGAFRKLGGYAEIPLMEDLELGRRMLRAGRVIQLPEYVMTSARRWQKKGLVRTIVLMWALRLLFNLGCPPRKLVRFYGNVR